jgi:hypothetical protein
MIQQTVLVTEQESGSVLKSSRNKYDVSGLKNCSPRFRILSNCITSLSLVLPLHFKEIVASLHFDSVRDSVRQSTSFQDQDESSNMNFGNTHIIRRLYGKEHSDVRREISSLEERIPRYQTGLPSDPDHYVPYENHPFDPEIQRILQESNGTTSGDGDNFRPMRIVFYTKALDDIRDSSNAAKIDWFENEILPKAAEFWSNALSVVPVSGSLKISSGELDSFGKTTTVV